MKILIAYASRHGSTHEVAEFIGNKLQDRNHEVTVADADSIEQVSEYDAFVLGTGIYRGTWLPAMTTFIRKHQTEIGQKPVYGFMLCIRILEPEGPAYVLEHYVPYYITDSLNMQDIKAFPGRLYVSEIDMSERWTLSLRYEGNYDVSEVNEDFRDWEIIENWTQQVAEYLEGLS